MNTNSQPRKIRFPESDVTKLKLLWHDSFTESDREFWRARMASAESQSEIRRDLNAKCQIQLSYDMQITRFRKWVAEQDEIEEETRKTDSDLAELELLGLTDDQLRNEILRRMKARAIRRGDYEFGLKAILADVKIETLQLGQEKFKEGLRTKIEAGLEAIQAEAKGNPSIASAVKQIREAAV